MNPGFDDPNRTTITTEDWVPGYEIKSVVGSGGFGTVYQAHHLKLDRIVAVKIIHRERMSTPTLADRFVAEAMTLGKLHHHNIVQVHDYDRHDGTLFIAMELLEGEDLEARVRRTGPVSERLAWAIARQAAAGLAHAEANGVVHRDIKPANLFLVPVAAGLGWSRDIPFVKVMDFGLARCQRHDNDPDEHLTAPGTILGTPVYMAPEQYRHATGVDHRADIYSLGATVHYALNGRPPFEGRTVWDVMAQKLENTPQLAPSVSRESAELLRAMMATDPDQRIGTYEELIDRIDQIPVMQASDLSPKAVRLANSRRRQARWWIRASVAIGLVVIAIGVVLLGREFIGSRKGSADTIPEPIAQYELSGERSDLFDGVSVRGWSPSPGGTVELDKDNEGSTVLSVAGYVRRTVPPVESYRVTLGLYLHTASAAEIHFAIPESGPRSVLRFSKAGGVVLGSRDGYKGTFQPLQETRQISFPSANWFGGRVRYFEVIVERAGGWWNVLFNRDEVGRFESTGKTAEEFWLRGDDGSVWVSEGTIALLKKK